MDNINKYATDIEGNYILDEDGQPIPLKTDKLVAIGGKIIKVETIQKFDEDGNPMFDENNNPIMETITKNNIDELISNLNRDVNNAQNITKELITSASNWQLTIDNTLMAPVIKGVEKILNGVVDGTIKLTKDQIENIKDALTKQEEELRVIKGVLQSYALAQGKTQEEIDEAMKFYDDQIAIIYNLKEEIDKISKMSEKHESNGDPKIIGWDKNGGFSYGSFQISTGNTENANEYGTMPQFLEFLKSSNPEVYTILMDAGGKEGAKVGSEAFKKAWEEVATMDGFKDVEKQFIYETHYIPTLNIIKQYDALVELRSDAVQSAIWGQGVQLGKKGNQSFFLVLNLNNNLDSMTDVEFIKAMYDYKISSINDYFVSSTQAMRDSILKRYIQERDDLLKSLGVK